jgi:hypothetical protein
MNNPIQTRVSQCSLPRFRDVSPSEAAQAELTWFFNEAESAIDLPSNFVGLLTGASASSLQEVERRAEAMHSARKIYDRLERLRTADALLLAGLYTERPWSDAVLQALPAGLAGAAERSPLVCTAYRRAIARGETPAKSVAAWIEEVVREGPAQVVATWRASRAASAPWKCARTTRSASSRASRR